MDSSDLERLVDYAERPRSHEWTLRSALVRYAQLAPQRASVVLELIRRTDGALSHLDGHPERVGDEDEPKLAVAAVLDEIGDDLARWAVERGSPPHDEIEFKARSAASALSELGIEREQWDGRRPPGRGRD